MSGKLPQLTLECNGCHHRWPTRAAAGSSIRCPQCGQVRRVPAERPGTPRAATAAAAAGPDAEAAALWAAEAPAETAPHLTPAEAAEGEQCSRCGAPMYWHSARTVLACLACQLWRVSPGAEARAAEHAAALDRRQARGRGAALADLDPAAAARARAARIDLRRRVELLGDHARRLVADLGSADDYADQADAQAAAALAATIRAYLPEIADAGSAAELGAITAELAALQRLGDYRELTEIAAEAEAEAADEYDDDGQAAEAAPGRPGRRPDRRPAVVPGYLAPDPDWRRYLSPEQVRRREQMRLWTPGAATLAAAQQDRPQ